MVKGTHQKYFVLTPQEFEDILEPEPEIIICFEEEEPLWDGAEQEEE
jgi:hypothetical protein